MPGNPTQPGAEPKAAVMKAEESEMPKIAVRKNSTTSKAVKTPLAAATNEYVVVDHPKNLETIPAGTYTVRVGSSSDNLPLSAPFSLTPADERPDLMVTNVRTVPPFPKFTDRVFFVASVLNRGTGPTPVNDNLRVSFSVDGQRVASSPGLRSSIPAGGMALVCGSEGVAWAISNRTASVRAEVDPDHTIEETIETNNQSTVTLSARPR